MTSSASSVDPGGHRSGFVGLVRKARDLSTVDTPLPVQSQGAGQE
ncbi:MAG: hypothetical protein P8R37_01395 [Opitutae bacterium]|nr:hypothetical protein [Opitutae bacterium]MDG1300226.1 hypothetical protein [Opitutae bacterium]